MTDLCAMGDDELGDDLHHLTGRGSDKNYLDPELVVVLCHDHHELIHDDLRQEQVDKPLDSVSAASRVARRLIRVALIFDRVAEVTPTLGCLIGVAAAMRRWAEELVAEEQIEEERDENL